MRVLGETEAGGLLPPRAGLASINLVFPVSVPRARSSAPARPAPHVPRIFSTRLRPRWPGRSPHPHSHPGQGAPAPSGSDCSPFRLSLFPWCPPSSSFLLSGLGGLPQRASLTPNFLFCPFLGCFPVGGGAGPPRAEGNAGKNYAATRRRERAVRVPLLRGFRQTVAELGERGWVLFLLAGVGEGSERALRRLRGGRLSWTSRCRGVGGLRFAGGLGTTVGILGRGTGGCEGDTE